MRYLFHCVTRVTRVIWHGFETSGCLYMSTMTDPEDWCPETKLRARGDDSLAYARWLYNHRPDVQ